jgi:hypothetical protein
VVDFVGLVLDDQLYFGGLLFHPVLNEVANFYHVLFIEAQTYLLPPLVLYFLKFGGTLGDLVSQTVDFA